MYSLFEETRSFYLNAEALVVILQHETLAWGISGGNEIQIFRFHAFDARMASVAGAMLFSAWALVWLNCIVLGALREHKLLTTATQVLTADDPVAESHAAVAVPSTTVTRTAISPQHQNSKQSMVKSEQN